MKLALRDDDSKVLPALTEDIVFSLLFFAGIPIATLFIQLATDLVVLDSYNLSEHCLGQLILEMQCACSAQGTAGTFFLVSYACDFCLSNGYVRCLIIGHPIFIIICLCGQDTVL